MKTHFLFVCALMLCISCRDAHRVTAEWPSVTRETKPWTRWWWHGSAVTREGITAELEAYSEAGLGGVEITPIYGVYGGEDSFLDYLSPQWMEMLAHTLKEADRLDLGVDMATGTGWPFGGPWVGEGDACKNLNYEVYPLKAGEWIKEPLLFHQEPYVRSVGTQIYEMHGIHSVPGQATVGTIAEPAVRRNARRLDISQLAEPVEANRNLQALALDQVKFDKQLEPALVMAYSDGGEVVNLTERIDAGGVLQWTAPGGNWDVYALFPGSHGKMVERAAPGGEGNVIDHFSAAALGNYLSRFDSAFAGQDLGTLRAFFNDSYEVDDARGTADWTPELFDEFLKRKGYDLREHLPALLGRDTKEKNERVLCDYRETISELVHDNFTSIWRSWAGSKGKLVRNQAHGSPANILDLYAEVDIPEMEGNEALRIKMASSSANVSGKRLISSESATWLNEHFLSSLSDIKRSVDLFLVSGVNHVFYHGTCYSPPEEPWPGRLFYAAVHLNPRNSLWNDFAGLNEYVTRSQSFLQAGTPANDVLLYFPIYDRFSTPGHELLEHFDGVGAQFDSTAFREAAEEMLASGYAFDYISDKQIGSLEVENGNLLSAGSAGYKTLVVPHGRYLPLETLRQLLELANKGATVIVYKGLPESFAGYAEAQRKKVDFDSLIAGIEFSAGEDEVVERVTRGSGRLLRGERLEYLLTEAGVQREELADKGLQFIRKGNANGIFYFITNWSGKDFDGTIRLSVDAQAAMLFDPLSGKSGVADAQPVADNRLSVRLQLRQGESLIVQTADDMIDGPRFPYFRTSGGSVTLEGPWSLSFVEGGPVLPPAVSLDSLKSWTSLDDTDALNFSGTARYVVGFEPPGSGEGDVLLDLGTVKESASVTVNGSHVGTLIGPRYTIIIDRELLTGHDTLEIRVSNLMANRIADLDRREVFWKRFYNINFPARLAANRKDGLFTAAGWVPVESGLLGPVTLSRVSVDE